MGDKVICRYKMAEGRFYEDDDCDECEMRGRMVRHFEKKLIVTIIQTLQ